MSTNSWQPICRELKYSIKALATPDDEILEPNKKFFPKSQLRRLLTKETIHKVLLCNCDSCTNRCDDHANTLDSDTSAQQIASQSSVLFALLLYIDCPQLITLFLGKAYDDSRLEDADQEISPKYIRQHFWPRYDAKDPHDSERLAEAFRAHKSKFAVPSFTDDLYSVYSSSTRLPFINQRPLGTKSDDGGIRQEGASGNVYAFRVPDEYRSLTRSQDVEYFARKELSGTDEARFMAERKNLERVQKLNDPHIVRYIKAYKHGNAFNFVFPCSKTNLDHYLRDADHRAPNGYDHNPECSPVWAELLGVTRALDRIIHYNAPGQNSWENFYGYHFDLKPANILVEENGKWLITDFGQAVFMPGTGTSRIFGRGGTEAYAPPEFDGTASPSNRKYDVWSLGCIFLEVCAFVMGGYKGVTDFGRLKTTWREDSHVQDDRLFRKKSASASSFEVKHQVLDWIKQLPERTSGLRKHSRKFLHEMMELTRSMLCVNVKERIPSNEVCKRLESILGRFQAVPLGERLAQKIPGIQYAMEPTNLAVNASVRLYEDSSRFLVASDLNDSLRYQISIGSRRHTRLRPVYATVDKENALHFQHFDDEEFLEHRLNSFSFRNSLDAITMQSILLGQDIKYSINLQGGHVEEKRSAKKEKKWHIRSGKANTEAFSVAAMVQLWSEESYKDPEAWHACQRKNSPRSLEDYFLHGPLPRRIVIYDRSTLTIVRLAKNVRLEKPASGISPSTHTLVPTNKDRDPKFTASVIRFPSDHVAIPLDRASLYTMETRNQVKCKSLTLPFKTKDDANSFWRAYQKLKKEWCNEEKELEELKKKMGVEIGWAPD